MLAMLPRNHRIVLTATPPVPTATFVELLGETDDGTEVKLVIMLDSWEAVGSPAEVVLRIRPPATPEIAPA
jgi:hypothetical protein